MLIGLLAVFTALCALFPIPAGGSHDQVLGAVPLFSMDHFSISNMLAAVFSSSPFTALDKFDPVLAPTRTAVIGSLEIVFLTLDDILPYAPSAYAPLPGSSPFRVRSDPYRSRPEYGTAALATPAPGSGGDLVDEAPATSDDVDSAVSDYRLRMVSLCNDIGSTIAHLVIKVYSSIRVDLSVASLSFGLDLLYRDIINALSEVSSAVYRNTFSVKYHSPISDAQAIQSLFRIVPKHLRKLQHGPGSVFFLDGSLTDAMRHIPKFFSFGPVNARACADAICLLLVSCAVAAILLARIPCTDISGDGVPDSEVPKEIEQEDDGETPDDVAAADESITVYYSSTSLVDTLPVTDETMKPTAVLLRVDGCDKVALAPEEIVLSEDDGEVSIVDEEVLLHGDVDVFTVSEKTPIQENDSGAIVNEKTDGPHRDLTDTKVVLPAEFSLAGSAEGSLDVLPENTPYSELLENRPERFQGLSLDRTVFIPRSDRLREVYFAGLAEQEKEVVVRRQDFLRARSMKVMNGDTAEEVMKASESIDSCKATIANSSLVTLGDELDDEDFAVPEDVLSRALSVDKLTDPRPANDDRKALPARIQFRGRVDRLRARGRDGLHSVKDEEKEEALNVEENVRVVPRDVPSRMLGIDYLTHPCPANDDRKALAARIQFHERFGRGLRRDDNRLEKGVEKEVHDVDDVVRVVPKVVQSRTHGDDFLAGPRTVNDDRKSFSSRTQLRERLGRGLGKDRNLVKDVEKEEARHSFDTKKAQMGDSFVSAKASHSLRDLVSIPSADAGDEAHCKKGEIRENRISSEMSLEKDLDHASANRSVQEKENKESLCRRDAAVVPASGSHKSRPARRRTPRGNGITPNAMSGRVEKVRRDTVTRASGVSTCSKERQRSTLELKRRNLLGSKFLRFNSNGEFSVCSNMPSYMGDVSSCGICRPDPARADGGWREGLWITCSGDCFQKMIFRDFPHDNWYNQDSMKKGGIRRVSRISGVAGGGLTPVGETKVAVSATNVKSGDDKVDSLNGPVVLSDDKDLVHVADAIEASEQEVQNVRQRPLTVHATTAEATESIVLASSVRSGYKNLLDETMPFDANAASTGSDMSLFDVRGEQGNAVGNDEALPNPTSTLQPLKTLGRECMEALARHPSKEVLPRHSSGRSTDELCLAAFNPQRASTPERKARKGRRSTQTSTRTVQTEISSRRAVLSAKSTCEGNESESIYMLRVREIFATMRSECEGLRSSDRPGGKYTPQLDRVREEASDAETPPPLTPFDETQRVNRRRTGKDLAELKEADPQRGMHASRS